MKHYNKVFGLFLILALLAIEADAQKNIENITGCYEKIYVHTDRNIYCSGEQLRYSMYLLDASTLLDKAQSKIVYFELLNADKQIVLNWHTNILEGKSYGSIAIPDSIKTGGYQLRTYTNWMKNLSPVYYFSTNLFIYNISNPAVETTSMLSFNEKDWELSIRPEGGNLFYGVENRVAYRINDSFDANTPWNILIADENNLTVENISVNKPGVGSLILTPIAGKTYRIRLISNNSVIDSLMLDEPSNGGYQLKVVPTNNGINVTVNSFFARKSAKNDYHLTAYIRGISVFDTLVRNYDETTTITINEKFLTKGLVYISVENLAGTYKSDELVYYNNEKNASIQIDSLSEIYKPGDAIHFSVSINNLSPDDTASFSVSVSQKAPLNNGFYNSDINRALTFISELSNIPYRFRNNDNLDDETINNLALSANTNEYLWNPENTINSEKCYPLENNGMILTGSIQYKFTNKPLRNCRVTATTIDSATLFNYSFTNNSGIFKFLFDKQFENKELVLQIDCDTLKNNSINWKIDSKEGSLPLGKTIKLYTDSVFTKYLQLLSNIYLVEKIFNNANLATSKRSNNQIQHFYIKPEQVIKPSDFLELPNFREITSNILPLVRYTKADGAQGFDLFDSKRNRSWLANSAVFLNGILFKDISYINSLGSIDIKNIDLVRSRVFYGDYLFNGIMAIYTYDNKVPATYLENYAKIYANRTEPFNMAPIESPATEYPMPDFKQTLYWNPQCKLANKKEFRIEMKAPDLKTDYILTIEGITKEGKTFSIRKNIKIE